MFGHFWSLKLCISLNASMLLIFYFLFCIFICLVLDQVCLYVLNNSNFFLSLLLADLIFKMLIVALNFILFGLNNSSSPVGLTGSPPSLFITWATHGTAAYAVCICY